MLFFLIVSEIYWRKPVPRCRTSSFILGFGLIQTTTVQLCQPDGSFLVSAHEQIIGLMHFNVFLLHPHHF